MTKTFAWMQGAALLTALVASIIRRSPLRIKILLAASCAMAAFVALNFSSSNDSEWLLKSWLPKELLSTAICFMCLTWQLLAETRHLSELSRFWLRFGTFLVPLAAVLIISMAEATHDTFYWKMVAVRSRLWQWQLLAWMITFLNTCNESRLSRDGVLSMWLTILHGFFGSLRGSQSPLFRVSLLIVCCWWILPRKALSQKIQLP